MTPHQACESVKKLPDISIKDHFGSDAFSEIENSWGRQGWTTINLKFIDKNLFEKALKAAWVFSAEKTILPTKNMNSINKKGKNKE
jgi:hypothetical protein